MDQTSKIFFCIVLCLIMSAAAAWVIAEHLAPGNLVLVFAGCLVGAGIMTAVLAILDATRAALLASVLIAAALVTIPLLRRFEMPKKVPYTAAAALFIGFVCSRLVYKES